jgi:hypothetical protein
VQQYVTLAKSQNCIGQIIGKPWHLPDHSYVNWLFSTGHQWRSPQCYHDDLLMDLVGEFTQLKREILDREKRE